MRLRFPIKIVIPAVFLIIALVVAAFELMDIPEALERVEERAVSSDVMFRMNRLEMTVERLIANGDIVGVQKEVSAFGVDADIKWLVLVDYNDRVIASTRIETVGAGIKETLGRFTMMDWDEFSGRAAQARKIYAGKAYIDKKKRLINGFFPVYFNIVGSGLRPALRGLLLIQYDYSAIRVAELHRSMMKIARNGAFIGGVMVLTWLFLYFALVRRARRLVKAAERFAAGELDARTMMEGSDELGAIGRAFDGMAGSIAAYQSHLRENEELLKQSEARFRNLVESTNDWVWELDVDLRYIYSNPKGSGLLGYAPSELLGRRFTDFMSVEERARFLEFFRPLAASKGAFFQFEHSKLTKDGRSVVFESTGTPVFDGAGALCGYRGIGRDITERKRHESVWRARLKIVEFSSAYATDDILQLTLDELEKLTGSSIGFYHFLEDDQNTLSLQNWSTNTLKTMCTAEGKGRHYNIADAGVWVDCVHERRAVIHNDYASLPHRKGMPAGHAPVTRELVVPIFRGDKIVAIIGVGNKMQEYDEADVSIISQIGDVSWDIVERKRAEEAVKLYQGHLEELVRVRTGELEAANVRLRELDRLKSMFIASMSHELRTPLNTIIGFVGIILQGMTGEISPEQRKQLTMVQDSSRHLLDLINDVIDISKIEAGKVDLSIGSFDLSALVKKTAEPFAVLADAKGVRFGVSAPAEFLIESDARRIRQVLVNIFGNAVKFTDSGSIDVKMVEVNGRVSVSVTDTGIGISGGDMGRLFESFSQIVVNGRPKEGSGLGLYLTRKIMDLLGGEIKAESAIGRGSVFTVILPVKYERR